MDPTYLTGLAEAGAVALVTAVVTDAWINVRSTAARVLAGGDGAGRQAATSWLDDTRRALMAMPADQRAEALTGLRSTLDEMLRARLTVDPAVGGELAEIIRRVAGSTDPRRAGVHQYAEATGGSQVYQAGGDIRIGGRRGRH